MEKGPFEQSIADLTAMTAELVDHDGRVVVWVAGFDGDMDLERLRYARTILTRAIQDLVRRQGGSTEPQA